MIEFKEVSASYWQHHVLTKYEHDHWKEVGQDKRWEPDLDWDLYRRLDDAGDLSIVCLMVDGEPRGYFVGMCGRPTHYKSKRIMRTDAFYIEPGYRQYGVRLFKEAMKFAKEHGAQKLYVTWKTYKDIEPILRRCKMVTIEKTAVADLG